MQLKLYNLTTFDGSVFPKLLWIKRSGTLKPTNVHKSLAYDMSTNLANKYTEAELEEGREGTCPGRQA